ncbi:MAG: transposase [Anaerolineaceae bacterium]|nr:transposase [Anaerolineaceae bacterium]
MKKEPIKRYSQAFKQQVVREYEAGASATSLAQQYGIGTHTTIKNWVKKYGCSGFRTEKVVIQTVADQVEVKAMKARIAALESALAESVLENRMLEATLAVASAELKLDLKKNFGNPLSGTSGRSSK